MLPYGEEEVMAIVSVVQEVFSEMLKVVDKLFKAYPNKRVLHLVKYGKWRVRKKNIRRFCKWICKHKEELE